ncbi:glutathione peroxidase 1 [Thraustotheca clavata]|uniref:Glutathione peroxidase 1 n=1 Tax=Thraustotheca clavata TaxID=74557 RepID=A0A1V9ZN55_9STRA|nr:glutathione peroxidase 1 [Thraustotheca clavata]
MLLDDTDPSLNSTTLNWLNSIDDIELKGYPGTNEEILAFAQDFGATFPIFEKADVNGPRTQPVFAYLKKSLPGTFGTQVIKWNFTKFLVDRDGQPYKRFGPQTAPIKLLGDIYKLLGEE